MPTLTTRAAVLDTAPELAAVPDPAAPEPSRWRGLLADVAVEVPSEAWPSTQLAELAQRLWVAHSLLVAVPSLQQRALASVTIGPTSKSYAPAAGASLTARDWLQLTSYGSRLYNLVLAHLGPAMAVL